MSTNKSTISHISELGIVPIIPTRWDWPSAIGNFILNFGTLDYFVFVFLKENLPASEFEKLRGWHLKDRLNRISLYLAEKHRSEREQLAFVALVNRLEPIRELRNHIAHGYLLTHFEKSSGETRVTLSKAKDIDVVLASDSKGVEFLEILDAVKVLPELIDDFQTFAGFKETLRITT